jgi:membrane protein
MGTVLGPELVDDVAAPFVRAQLSEAQSGIALGGLVVALWLGSRVFLPAVQALDLAFDAVEDRSVLRQRLIALAVAVSSLVVMNLQLLLLVFGPLLGGGREIAARFGLGPAFRVLWEAGRWPVVALVITTFLVTIYRFVPRRRLGWRQSLPGAVVATASWLVIAVGFRVYLAAGATPGRGLRVEAEALVVAGRAVGALVATVLWVFLSSIAVLFGGEINAAIARRRDARPPSDAPAGGAQATDDAQRPD